MRGRHAWGPWNLDPSTAVLWTAAGGYRYEVDLERCRTSAEVLDWILQIAKKTWGEPPPVVAGLVRALDDVLEGQAPFCSFGASKRLPRAAILTRVARFSAPREGLPCERAAG